MSGVFYDCADCGSEFCPCDLAETGDCSVCGMLSGNDKCDCDWKGVCVYSEFIQSGGKAVKRREERETEITERKDYGDDITVFGLNTGRGYAIRCSRPGSYIFARNICDDKIFDVPLSVIKSDIENGVIYTAFLKTGIKTRRLAEADKRVIIRGVYANGILGLKNITGIRGRAEGSEKIMVIAKGIGIAPAVLLSTWLEGRAEADVYIDKSRLTDEFAEDCIKEIKCGRTEYIDLSGECCGIAEIKKNGNYDKVVMLASDHFTDILRGYIHLDAVSNNFHMCCGDGICGACGYTDRNGKNFRMCKCAQIPV